MNLQEKHKIRIILAVGLLIMVAIPFLGNNPLIINTDVPIKVTIPDDNFTKFALIVSMLYEAIPSVAKHLYSASIISDKLLIQGFSPILFGVLLGIGQLIGQMVLYVVGMFVKHVHKGGIGNLASSNHFLHQHHFLIYLTVPFIGLLGDALMLYSGHERINPIKMIPFLLASNIADNLKWVYTQMFNLRLSESFIN